MTTIAYRAGVLAADTAMYASSLMGHTVKIAQRSDGCMAGAAGSAVYGYAFIKWFEGGESGPPPEAKQDNDGLDRAAIFRVGGTIELYEPGGMFLVEAPYFAIGSGRPEALGAMFVGADAEQAVRAAMHHDPHTGGEVTTLRRAEHFG